MHALAANKWWAYTNQQKLIAHPEKDRDGGRRNIEIIQRQRPADILGRGKKAPDKQTKRASTLFEVLDKAWVSDENSEIKIVGKSEIVFACHVFRYIN